MTQRSGATRAPVAAPAEQWTQVTIGEASATSPAAAAANTAPAPHSRAVARHLSSCRSCATTRATGTRFRRVGDRTCQTLVHRRQCAGEDRYVGVVRRCGCIAQVCLRYRLVDAADPVAGCRLQVALVALAAIAALAFGWHQHDTRRVFMLSLQGGAIGVLLITVFAAFRLYDRLPLPPAAAFALLIVLVAGVVFAGRVAGCAGTGGAWPAGWLSRSDPGVDRQWQPCCVVLLLRRAQAGGSRRGVEAVMAGAEPARLRCHVWHRYGVGSTEISARAVRQHRTVSDSDFLFYLVIPLLYLLRAPDDRRKVIDGCLLFGNPLISLLLQAALLHWRGQLAISALVVAAMYVAVAWNIRERGILGILRDAWLT